MSLILEALRKSEAERRRGQTPDLLAEPAPVKRAPRAVLPRGWRWALAVIALLAIAWLVRSVFSLSADSDADADADAVRPASAEIVERDVPVRRDRGRAEAAPDRAPVLAAPAAEPSVSTPPIAKPPAPTVATVEPPPAPTAEVRPRAPSQATAPPASTASSIISEPAPLPTPRTAPPPQAAPPQAATSSPPLSGADTPLRLADLSTEERQQLPPLKISMHMWAEDPARRFVIIDGNRMAEGDRVGNAVIESISSDGVVLVWQGRRVRLPIR